MRIKDRIYGLIEIEKGVIVDLIKSNPFQRLKKISQDGAPHFIQPIRNVTRYEHSIGVWFLSNYFKRPVEEQVAALLHDISHTAFSHVIDFVVNDLNHEFHEKFIDKVILDSKIPKILEKHKIDIRKVLNKGRFKLLENNLPDISVDRWDYFMRDGYTLGFLPQELINNFLQNIKIKEDKFYFEDIRLASAFAILFVNFSRLIWLDPTSHGSFFLLAESIKEALKRGVITKADFFTDDEFLLKKLKKANIKTINKYLKRLTPGREFVYADRQHAEFFGPNKPRFVDPFVETRNGLRHLSEIVPNLKYFFEEFSLRYRYLGVKQK